MASCSPVLAPLGTAARPMVPSARNTSASTVGLPRLSRISRAAIRSMIEGIGRWNCPFSGSANLLFPFSLRCHRVFGGVDAVEPPHLRRHTVPDDLHQLGAVVV